MPFQLKKYIFRERTLVLREIVTTMSFTALTKPQKSGLLPKNLQCHIVGVIIVFLEVAAFSKSTVDKSRHTQIYTEIMIPWKTLR